MKPLVERVLTHTASAKKEKSGEKLIVHCPILFEPARSQTP